MCNLDRIDDHINLFWEVVTTVAVLLGTESPALPWAPNYLVILISSQTGEQPIRTTPLETAHSNAIYCYYRHLNI